MTTLFTIGYSKHTPDSLFERLKSAGVRMLVDVRELPISRKIGFAKSALASWAAKFGIEYRHVKLLGVPAEMRHRKRDGGIETDDYMAEFRNLLQTRSDSLREALELAVSLPCCLLCLEERPEDCHRTIVAEELVKLAPDDVSIVHL